MAARTNGFSSSSSTGPSATNGRSGRNGPFPHIDDLTSVAVDLDLHSPLKKVLEIGEGHMRQAITFSQFRRPDLALQEYIRAFTIAVDKIPKHKDYPSLKTNRGDLGRQYNALKLNITNNGDKFDKIKEEIKEDNRRSGVQSKKSAAEASLLNLPNVPSTLPHHQIVNGVNGLNGASGTQPPRLQKTQDIDNGQVKSSFETQTDNSSGNTPKKAKPAVQPKPQALHGNAIKPTTNPVAQDLASRFARLRDPQDNSNRAAVAVVPKPGDVREAPLTTRSQSITESTIPVMPKLPDAIYSPARGTVTSEVADLPSSTPRGMFSRTNSIASMASSSARNSIDVNARPAAAEQFVTAHNFGNGFSSAPTSPRIQVPGGATITPQQLQEYMRKGATIARLLLIDVRSREEFDEGHILSQSTICVEPAVLARGNVSAADIEESLGIAPDEEMAAFEKRSEFDLVVFYDQDSASIPSRPSQHDQETSIFTLYQALVHFNYGAELRHGPKLLEGGVDAWVDLCGHRSLQESRTSAAIQSGSARPRRTNAIGKSRFGDRRRARAQTKALKPEEIKQFEDSLQKDEPRQEYIRSTEDFLRRYPSTSEIQESMAPSNSQASFTSQHLNRNVFESDLPPVPPTRPAPAVPRTSYSGLSSKEPTSDVVYAKSGRVAALGRDRPSGLENTSNNCFANSAIQVILFSPGFAAEFTKQDWPSSWAPAVKNPQLMARILGNLLQWLAGRQFPALRPTTLLKYSRSIHSGYLNASGRRLFFGDGSQHDASEYLVDFILPQLGVETNRKSDMPVANFQAPGEDLKKVDAKAPRKPELDLAIESWRRWTSFTESILTQYWTVSFLTSGVCNKCSDTVDSFSYEEFVNLGLGDFRTSSALHVKDILEQTFNTTETRQAGGKGYDCGVDVGEQHMDKSVNLKLARLPPLLCFRLMRFEGGQEYKNQRRVNFDIDGLDMTNYAIDTSGNVEASKIDGFGQERLYDLYAVICHIGDKIEGGHYMAYVRDGTTADQWFECNDTRIYKRQLGKRMEETDYGGSREPIEKMWFESIGRSTPFLLFYKRRDKPWEYPNSLRS